MLLSSNRHPKKGIICSSIGWRWLSTRELKSVLWSLNNYDLKKGHHLGLKYSIIKLKRKKSSWGAILKNIQITGLRVHPSIISFLSFWMKTAKEIKEEIYNMSVGQVYFESYLPWIYSQDIYKYLFYMSGFKMFIYLLSKINI